MGHALGAMKLLTLLVLLCMFGALLRGDSGFLGKGRGYSQALSPSEPTSTKRHEWSRHYSDEHNWIVYCLCRVTFPSSQSAHFAGAFRASLSRLANGPSLSSTRFHREVLIPFLWDWSRKIAIRLRCRKYCTIIGSKDQNRSTLLPSAFRQKRRHKTRGWSRLVPSVSSALF